MPDQSMTDIEKYDRAVYGYLLDISPRIVYAPTSMALRTITKREEFQDKKPWQLISYFRSPQFDINWNLMNNHATVTGDFVRLTGTSDTDRTARYVHNVPISLTYSVDLWASKSSSAQELAIALISKIYMQDQVLEAPINPDGEPARFHILDVSWTDNSDLERETEIGRIYRHTISFSLDSRITLVRDVPTTRFKDIPVNIYEEYEGGLGIS